MMMDILSTEESTWTEEKLERIILSLPSQVTTEELIESLQELNLKGNWHFC